MHNRLLAFSFNDHDCLIHLRFDGENMEVNILDDYLYEQTHLRRFWINKQGELAVDEHSGININRAAVTELHRAMLSQQKDGRLTVAA